MRQVGLWTVLFAALTLLVQARLVARWDEATLGLVAACRPSVLA